MPILKKINKDFFKKWLHGIIDFLEGLKEYLKNHFNLKGGYIYKKNRGYDLVFSIKDSLKLFEIMYNSLASNFLERKY